MRGAGAFPGFRPAALTFLRGLARNNRREWFEARREAFERDLRQPLRELVEAMDVRLAAFAPEIVGDPAQAIFRIHRDVRFSADKSPYKTNLGFWLYHRAAGKGIRKEGGSGGAGFYFHLEPGAGFVAGGLWRPTPPALAKLREAIVEDRKGFERVVLAPAFRRRFGGLTEEEMLTRVPRGFAPEHPAARWLRFRSFTASRPLTDAQLLDARLPVRLEREYAALLPLVRWLNGALGYRAAERR
jgi:uncharacterized protein (TIGR02453 family)